MDRFKFRCFFKKSVNLMCEVLEIDFDRELLWVMAICEEKHYGRMKFDDVVLMQCTGEKDIDGDLIYEGDVLESDGGDRATVIFDDCSFSAFDKETGTDVLLYTKCKTIGNIYQNPDLLRTDSV
jgi:hypothetical protein